MPRSQRWFQALLLLCGFLAGGGCVVLVWSLYSDDGEPTEGLFPAADLSLLLNPPQPTKADLDRIAFEEKLHRIISCEYEDAELEMAIKTIARDADISILLDPEGLEEAGVTADHLVNFDAKNVEVRVALNLLLGPRHLSYRKQEGVLIVTSAELCSEWQETRLYNIRDMLSSSWARRSEYGVGTSNKGFPGSFPTRKKARWELAADEIVEIIQGIVQPDSWADNGGPSSIEVYRGMLVITQTEEGHHDVEALLRQLRYSEYSLSQSVLVVQ